MTVEEPASLAQVLDREDASIRLFADMGGLAPNSWPRGRQGSRIALAIGPEGGWTAAERQLAADRGWTVIGLGPTRLRVETAALAATAIIFSQSPEIEE